VLKKGRVRAFNIFFVNEIILMRKRPCLKVGDTCEHP